MGVILFNKVRPHHPYITATERRHLPSHTERPVIISSIAVHPGVLRVQVPDSPDLVAHGVLHHRGHHHGQSRGRHQVTEHAAEGVRQQSSSHRSAVRGVALAVKLGVPPPLGVVHTDDQGADARAGVRVRRRVRHGEADTNHVVQHVHHRNRSRHRGVRRVGLYIHRRRGAAQRVGVRGAPSDAGAGAHHAPGVRDEPDPIPVLRLTRVRRLPGHALHRGGTAGDPGGCPPGDRLRDAPPERAGGVRVEPGGFPAHR